MLPENSDNSYNGESSWDAEGYLLQKLLYYHAEMGDYEQRHLKHQRGNTIQAFQSINQISTMSISTA